MNDAVDCFQSYVNLIFPLIFESVELIFWAFGRLRNLKHKAPSQFYSTVNVFISSSFLI